MSNKFDFGLLIKIVFSCISFVGLFLVAYPAHAAFNLEYGSVIYSYGNCKWGSDGSGSSKLSMGVSFKRGFGSSNAPYWSRGIMVYTYDKNGNLKDGTGIVKAVYLNGVNSTHLYYGNEYAIFYAPYKDAWRNQEEFFASVEVVVDDSKIADWPAVSVRAANATNNGNDVAEITGGAYFARDGTGTTCRIVDPGRPPPLPIAISMTAPDWNLGELPQGDGEKIFQNSPDQLCFTYSGAAVSGKQFIINAGSANGVAGNRYRLKNMKDATQFVPYSLTLDSGTSNVSLPNASNKSLSLNSSGRTCFVPTFKTTVDPTVKGGDYSDVLTFTVVTKS
ncbi:MAG: hypothetical protein V4796_19215 [Burkholderia cenocepacia]